MFGWFKKKAAPAAGPSNSSVGIELGVERVAALKDIILERSDLKQRLLAASPLDVFIAEVVAISVEEGLPFSSDDFRLYAQQTGKSLPSVCMAYFGGGFM
jgi:hypothetical protein